MNRRGFTLIELLVIIAIIAIVVGVVFSQYNDAMGANLQTLLPATEAVVEDIAPAMKNDPDQFVVILVYSADWDSIDWSGCYFKKSIDKMKEVTVQLHDLGVPEYQIKWLLANKGGLDLDLMPTPATDGVYLYLE